MTYNATISVIPTTGGNYGQMKETLRQIGSAIRRASVYPPIRNHAAAIASTAPPKDFLGQVKAIYNDFISRWRYVKDPVSRELVTASPEAIWKLTIAGDGIGVGAGKGAGDCDCATVALGAMLESTGFPIRIGTTAHKNSAPGRLFHHVFIQTKVPKFGWVTVDPVLYPRRPFGAIAHNSRIAYWDLDGRLLGHTGNVAGRLSADEINDISDTEEDDMRGPNIENWANYGFGADIEPEGWSEPDDWSTVGILGFGYVDGPYGLESAVAKHGIIDGTYLGGLMAEVDEDQEWAPGLYRTPMIEKAEDDYEYIQTYGEPYHGMLALGDSNEVYYYDGLGGFFKRLWKKVKRGVKKVARKIKKGIKKVLRKTKFGRWLIKIGGKIKKIAMKIVKPLAKFVGKWAGKLAPIAAIIPGYGTAIAAGLAAAGKIAKLMTKYGVKTKGKKGTVRGLKLKNPKKLPGFRKALKSEAGSMKKLQQKDPRKFKRLLAKAKRLGR